MFFHFKETAMNKKPDLSNFSFFSGISSDRLDEIESFSFVQTYEKGAAVFENSEPARNMYGLIRGGIDLSILFKDKIVTKDIKYEEYIRTHVEILEKPMVLETVKSYSIFGWSAMVEPEKMTATAICTSDCDIVVIPASELKKILENDPELGYLVSSRINSIIAQRLNSRTEKLVDTWCTLFETESVGTV